MSAMPASAAPAKPRSAVGAPARGGQPARGTQRQAAQLRVVRAKSTPAKAPFVLLVSVLLGSGLVLVLLVNTWLAQGSFEVRQLQKTQADLAARSQALAQAIAAESAPQSLAVQADGLGLVPAPNPVFKGTDGRVLGTPSRAVRPAPPAPPAPPASAAATPSASATPGPTAKPGPTATPSASATPGPTAKPGPTATPSAAARSAAAGAKPPTPSPSGAHR